MKESRKSTAVIVPSQMEIIDTLPEDIQLKVYKALFNYELFGTDFDEELLRNPVIQALWIMSKPLINKRIQWAENGRNGGLAKGKNSKSKANQKQTDSKPIANQKQTDSKSKADMDMEKDMDMEMEYPYLSGDIKNISPDRTDKERENKRESESIVEEIGDKIKELRKEKKLTQKELASAIGVTQGVIHFWETGRNKPSTYNLILLSRVLGRSLINDLFKEKADLLDSFEQDMEKIKKETLEQHEDEDDDWDWDWDKIPDPKQIGSGEVNV